MQKLVRLRLDIWALMIVMFKLFQIDIIQLTDEREMHKRQLSQE